MKLYFIQLLVPSVCIRRDDVSAVFSDVILALRLRPTFLQEERYLLGHVTMVAQEKRGRSPGVTVLARFELGGLDEQSTSSRGRWGIKPFAAGIHYRNGMTTTQVDAVNDGVPRRPGTTWRIVTEDTVVATVASGDWYASLFHFEIYFLLWRRVFPAVIWILTAVDKSINWNNSSINLDIENDGWCQSYCRILVLVLLA